MTADFAMRDTFRLSGSRWSDSPAWIGLSVPADSSYMSLVRAATAALAARQEFTLDEIADLQVAANEACSLLIADAAPGSEVTCEFVLEPRSLGVSITAHSCSVPPDCAGFAWSMLEALTDDVETHADGAGVTITLTKRHARSPESRSS